MPSIYRHKDDGFQTDLLVPADRMFVATLYTADNDKIMRYTDEVSRDRAPRLGRNTDPGAFCPSTPPGRDYGALQVDS